MKAGEALTVLGAAGSFSVRRSRAMSALSGVALLAASAATRWGIFHAGLASARDPRYTVLPQQERLRRRFLSSAQEPVRTGNSVTDLASARCDSPGLAGVVARSIMTSRLTSQPVRCSGLSLASPASAQTRPVPRKGPHFALEVGPGA